MKIDAIAVIVYLSVLLLGVLYFVVCVSAVNEEKRRAGERWVRSPAAVMGDCVMLCAVWPVILAVAAVVAPFYGARRLGKRYSNSKEAGL